MAREALPPHRSGEGFPLRSRGWEGGLFICFKGNLLHKELPRVTSMAEENSPSPARTLQSGLRATSLPHYGGQFQPSISPRD